MMTKNTGEKHRRGAVTGRTLVQQSGGDWQKREERGGQFMERRSSPGPHSRAVKESGETFRLAAPAHPGAFIKTEIIEPLGLSVTAAAQALGVTRPALSALLNARASLSAEMAMRIEKAFGVKLDTLMRMQTAYDIAIQRQRDGDIKVSRYEPKVA